MELELIRENIIFSGDALLSPGPSASTSATNVSQSSGETSTGENRSALLDSICSFNKSALKKSA